MRKIIARNDENQPKNKVLDAMNTDFYVKNITFDFIAAYQVLHKKGPTLSAINYAIKERDVSRVPRMIRELMDEKWVYEVNHHGNGASYETDVFL
jgi:hypothetical protein